MDLLQLQYQCELYQLLLNSSYDNSKGIDFIIKSVLDLIVKITQATIGYIELKDNNNKLYWSTYQCSDREILEIKKRISSGIITEALEFGETIVTPAAYLDPRFKDYESVQAGTIKAVLCSPIKTGTLTGVIYLEGNKAFDDESKNTMMDSTFFSRHIAPLLLRLNSQLEPQTRNDIFGSFNLSGIVGKSTAIIEVLTEAMALAPLDVTVLLTGKTGTGKTHIAKAIHQNSSRKNGPFIHLNCANFPEQLVESELFGFAKGAHSSAFCETPGKLAAADKGTLFLDEIGELAVNIQSKFLHFLEEGYFFPLGSSKPVASDIRIIVASNIDFSKAIEAKVFRPDLFYRINVFSIYIPPLKERKEDIFALITFFVKKYADQFKIKPLPLSMSAVTVLEHYDWPGNIRQLENMTQQALIRAFREHASQLMLHHFLLPDTNQMQYHNLDSSSYRQEKDNWEKLFIVKQLENHHWHISNTAKNIGLSRSHMNNLLKYHNLETMVMRKKSEHKKTLSEA